MAKTHAELRKEEVALIRAGRIHYEPDPSYIIVHDKKKFQAQYNALLRLNGLPPKEIDWENDGRLKVVEIRSAKASTKRKLRTSPISSKATRIGKAAEK